MEALKAKVVDIPFAKWDPPAELATGCRHERSDGQRCGRAIWQNEMCGVHGEWHNTVAAVLGLPFPEDQLSFHRFLLKTLDMVVSGKLQPRQAAAVEGLCKMIYKNLRTGKFEV